MKQKFAKLRFAKKPLALLMAAVFFVSLANLTFPEVTRAALCAQQSSTPTTEACSQQQRQQTNPRICDAQGNLQRPGGYQTCKLDEIRVRIDTYVGSQFTNPDNYVRVGYDGTLTLGARVNLVSPDQLTFDSDELDFNNGDDKEIANFGFGVMPRNQNATRCARDSKIQTYSLLLGDSTSYIDCSFDYSQTGKQAQVVTAGEVLMQGSVTIPGFELRDRLGMTQPGRYEVYIYPTMFYDGIILDSRVVLSQAGKSIYVEVFNTQAEANAANAAGRPRDIPAYGTGEGTASPGVSGSPLLGFINQFINLLVGLLQQLVYFIFYVVIAPLIQAMLSIRTYTDTFAAVIYPGWEVVRNVCNILFILALIAIGLGTLFRVESYQYKHLLVDLIIAALLVNFSLVIAQAILGVADTVQSQFLPNNVEVIRSLARDLMSGWKTMNWSNLSDSGFFSDTVQPLFSLALSLGSFVVFASVAVMLIIRIIMLWVLLMLSPLAYALRVLPTTKSYASKWWGEFLKYAFFTPIMAFFLNMAAVINNTYNSMVNDKGSVLQKIIDNPDTLGNSDVAQFVFRVGSNFIILIFLIAAIRVSEQAGVYGADAIAKAAKGGMLLPFQGVGWLGKKGAGRFGRWYNEKTAHLVEQHGDHPVSWKKKVAFAMLNPKAFGKGWQERGEELKHHAQEEAAAAGRMVAEQFLTGGWRGKPQLVLPYNQFTARKHENDYLKDYENMRKESLMAAAVSAEKMGGAEGTMRRRAIVKAAAKQGYMDDLLRMKHFASQFADADGTFYSAEVLNRFMSSYLADEKGNLGEQALRFMAEDMEELGKSTGHYEYLGHAYFDTKSGAFRRGFDSVGDAEGMGGRVIKGGKLKNTWQAGYAIGELKKISGRMRAQIAPHNLMTLRAEVDPATKEFAEKGNQLETQLYGRPDGQLDEYQRSAVAQFDAATLQQSSFAQGRMKEWLLSFKMDKSTGELIVETPEDLARIESMWNENQGLVRAMYAQMLGVDATQSRQITGVKVAYYKPDGSSRKQVATTVFGADPMGNSNFDAPIVRELAPEIIEGRENGLNSLKGEDKVKMTNKLAEIIPQVHKGAMDRTAVAAELSGFMTANPAIGSNANVNNITNKIVEGVKLQIDEKYDPQMIIDKLDSKVKAATSTAFSVSEANDLRQAVARAYKKAFEETVAHATASRPMAASDLESKIKDEIHNLATNPSTTNAKYIAIDTNDTYKAFVNHILPTI